MTILVKRSDGWKNVSDAYTTGPTKRVHRVLTKINSTTWKEVPIEIPIDIYASKSVRNITGSGTPRVRYTFTYRFYATDVPFTSGQINLRASLRPTVDSQGNLGSTYTTPNNILSFTTTKGGILSTSEHNLIFELYKTSNSFYFYHYTNYNVNFTIALSDGNTDILRFRNPVWNWITQPSGTWWTGNTDRQVVLSTGYPTGYTGPSRV